MAKKEKDNKDVEKKEGSVDRTLLDQWFSENIVDDVDENMMIASVAMEVIRNKFSSEFKDERLVLAFYGIVYKSIIEVLCEKRADHPSYSINIADRFEIGYTDADETNDMEKMGSFVPYMYDKECTKKTYDNVEERKTLDVCVSWFSQNQLTNVNTVKEISMLALKSCAEKIELHLSNWECVIPLFIMIHESMISVLKLKQAESGEYEIHITFAGCYEVFVRVNEDKTTSVEFAPDISSKLAIKSDAIASSKYE